MATVSRDTLHSIIHQKVSVETTIHADSFYSFRGRYEHYAGPEALNHHAGEYVRGNASINGIEGFRAYAQERLLRHDGFSPDYFLLYFNEMEYRFNHRRLDPTDVPTIFFTSCSHPLVREVANALG